MQRTASLEDQIRNCRRFAAQMRWEVATDHVYQDNAVSGFGIEQRPAYQRLVAAALSAVPPFTVILVDVELSNLVEFVVKGQTSSSRLRDEITVREQRLVELDQQIQRLRTAMPPARREVDQAWVEALIKKLTDLLRTDPAGPRRKIQKHLDDLRMEPAADLGERAVRVTGRPKVGPWSFGSRSGFKPVFGRGRVFARLFN